MKLIALKEFAKVGDLMDVEIKGTPHDRHVHKGAIFEIGTAKVLTGPNGLSGKDRQLVASLILAGCVGDATDEKVVKAVNEDVAADKKREETAAKLNAAASGSSLVEQLTKFFQTATAGPKAEAK